MVEKSTCRQVASSPGTTQREREGTTPRRCSGKSGRWSARRGDVPRRTEWRYRRCNAARTPTLGHTNGLALCKLHHAAYDRNILGICPDYTVEIHHRLLDEIDGPMLRHGLQGHHGRPLMQVPVRRADRPDTDRLMERYRTFLAA